LLLPPLAKLITMDNLMFAYLITTVIGAIIVKRMGAKFPTLLTRRQKGEKGEKEDLCHKGIQKHSAPL